MGKPKIAVQLYSVRDDLARDMPGTVKKVAAIGYEAVEFFGNAAYTADEVNAVLKENGLGMAGWHTPWGYVQDDFINVWISYCKSIGNIYVVVPGLPGELTSSVGKWRETAGKFNAIAAKLAKEGLFLGYHNHWTEFLPIEEPGVLPWDAFFALADPAVIAQYDIGNSLHGTGIDAMKYHAQYVGRGKTVHAKSFAANKEAAAIGEDDLDWERYVAEIVKANVTDYIIVEYEHRVDDLYDKLATCYKTIKKYL